MLLSKSKLALGSFPTIRSHDLPIFWCKIGISVALDISVVSPLNPSTLAEAGATVGAVLEATESRKHQANDEKCSALGWVSTPLAVDSYGAWGKEASFLFEQVAARLAIHKSLPKSQASFDLFSNLSICLITANARASVEPYLSVFDVYSCMCHIHCINFYTAFVFLKKNCVQ